MAVPRRPDPQPLESDDVAVVAAGTALWALGLVAAVVLRGPLAAAGNGSWVWVCAAGVFLGLVGLRHVHRRREVTRRDAGARRAEAQATPREPLT
jgi:hypothetical protein